MPIYTDTRGIHVRRARWHFDNGVGTVEVLVPIGHLVASKFKPEGVTVEYATEAEFKAYALRLLGDCT